MPKEMIDLFKNCISLDAETTGLDPERHGIFSVSLVSLTNDNEHTFECYLRDDCEISKEALKVNGQTLEELYDRKNHLDKYMSEAKMVVNVAKLLDHYGTHVIVGKNPRFDRDMLRAALGRNIDYVESNGVTWTGISHRTIDYSSLILPLMLLQGMTVPKVGFSSDEVSNFLGIPPEEKPHTSINGARHNKKCLLAILDMYQKLGIKIS